MLGGIALAPFTGGTSLAAALGLDVGIGGAVGGIADSLGAPTPGGGPSPMTTAGAVGQTAGSIEQQRANALIQEARLQQEQDRLALDRTTAGVDIGNLDLGQKRQALAAPGAEAANSVRGDVLANGQDATFSGLPSYIHIPTMAGGLRPSMLSGSSRALGSQMSRDALTRAMSGADTRFAPLPTVPSLTPLPTSSGYDTGLQGVATAGGFLNALRGVGGRGGSASSAPGFVAGETFPNGIPIDPENPANASADPFAQLPGASPAPSALDASMTGIDPALLQWFQQQGTPVTGGNG